MQTRPVEARKQFRFLPRLVWLSSVAALAACLLFVMLSPGTHPIAPAIIQMRALRGPNRAAQLTAGQSALLVFDVAGQATPTKYEVEVVDLSGKAIWTVETEAKGDTLSVPVRKLKPGSYWSVSIETSLRKNYWKSTPYGWSNLSEERGDGLGVNGMKSMSDHTELSVLMPRAASDRVHRWPRHTRNAGRPS